MKPLRKSLIFITISILLITILSGCGTIIPTATATPTFTNTPVPPTETPVPPTDTPVPTPTETAPPPPTNPPPPPPTSTPIPPTATPSGKPIYIYFIEKSSTKGCSAELVPLLSGAYDKHDPILNVEAALRNLFLYKTEFVGKYYNPLAKSKLSVANVDYDDVGARFIVELSGEITKIDEKCDGPFIFNMIVKAIRQFPGYPGNPDITLNGVGIKNFLY